MTLFLYRFIEICGLNVLDHLEKFPEFLAEVGPLVAQSKVKHREDFVDGFESIPDAFPRLFDGSNRGKLIARVG